MTGILPNTEECTNDWNTPNIVSKRIHGSSTANRGEVSL